MPWEFENDAKDAWLYEGHATAAGITKERLARLAREDKQCTRG